MLMSLPEDEWPERITKDRIPFTENTKLDYDEIIEDLRKSKARGYGIDNVEWEPGIRCIGMPVYNMAGELVAGASISGSVNTMTDEKIIEHSILLKEGVYRMQQRLYK